MSITPEEYIESNDLTFLEGKIVDLITRYVDFNNGSLLLLEAREALNTLIEKQKVYEDIEAQIPLWENDIISNRGVHHAK